MKWTIEYEIPPLRAIYTMECSADYRDEAQARNLFENFYPDYKIRKLTITPNNQKEE